MGNPGTVSVMKSSISVKALIIGVLILILLIPAALVQGLIHEREDRRDEAVRNIAAKWGQAQTITGPIISVPYKVTYKENKGGEPQYSLAYLHFLPDTLNLEGSLAPEIRYRGIYEAVLYGADLSLSGHFSHPRSRRVDVPAGDILWEQAVVQLGVSDMVGIRDTIETDLSTHGKPAMNPGVPTTDLMDAGVSAPLPLDGPERGDIPFSFHLRINGNERLEVTPVGKITQVKLAAPWPSPGFSGAYLPQERTITDKDFTATWRTLHLNRNYPQEWAGGKYRVSGSAFGVKLHRTVDIYQKSERTAKYAALFITFAFTAFFVSEIMNRRRVHPIQYLLVGFAVVLFYTLLIALSEQISFGLSYLIAATAVIGMITGYARAILGSLRMAGMVGSLLFLLYGFLFVVLQLEDYALLMGSIGLFVVLAGVMYLTRHIDWYRVNLDEEGSGNGPRP
ncbi:MAG: cell envelope integrity protein CreD [Nitrospirota bacterium]|nr:cell envelope integrity protein CreD [Nitrospirota bacterium]